MLYYHGSFITDAKTAKANGIGPVALVVVSGAFVVSGALAGLITRVRSLRCDRGGGGGGDGSVEGEEGESGIVVAVAATCRFARSVTAFAAIAANVGSAGNLLFPTNPASARRQRTRETPPGEVEVVVEE